MQNVCLYGLTCRNASCSRTYRKFLLESITNVLRKFLMWVDLEVTLPCSMQGLKFSSAAEVGLLHPVDPMHSTASSLACTVHYVGPWDCDTCMQQPKDDTANSYLLPYLFMSPPVTPLILDYCIPALTPPCYLWDRLHQYPLPTELTYILDKD